MPCFPWADIGITGFAIGAVDSAWLMVVAGGVGGVESSSVGVDSVGKSNVFQMGNDNGVNQLWCCDINGSE